MCVCVTAGSPSTDDHLSDTDCHCVRHHLYTRRWIQSRECLSHLVSFMNILIHTAHSRDGLKAVMSRQRSRQRGRGRGEAD